MRASLYWLAPFALAVAATDVPIDVGVGCVYDSTTAYPGPMDDKRSPAFVWTVSNATATFVRLRFDGFALPPNDYVRLSSLEVNSTEGPLVLSGRNYSGSFDAPAIATTSLRVELFTTHRHPFTSSNESTHCYGFRLGSYNTEIERTRSESICGKKDRSVDAICLEGNPVVFQRSKAIARLVIRRKNQLFGCTGWLLGCEGHLMTNHHCIFDALDASNTKIEFLAQAKSCPGPAGTEVCNRALSCRGQEYTGAITFVTTNARLDYTLLKLDTSVATTYGYLKLRPSGPRLGEPAYLITHPMAWGKRIAFKDANGTALLRVGSDTQVSYDLDTQKMSSGSPVLSFLDHSVVALHHAGYVFCPNLGIMSHLLHNDLVTRQILPSYCDKPV
ncbi:hypothetical protein SPRG_04774 [Saprolegnia parasitica CBS 223.65]|uniref:Serine protease n=1 Tax=Saprolegnia parasitica (strain CBS 223.65) TaxID=695850 RepID=A0A067CVP4_SAPPC|nr:hypothetical protein SPRG_04774 [Saprolegnia parasitica CBS 223.65]KDO30872.1 hypothetical protein SPRG_04774 [Saprolegnia parasitica CBS 223.65]|eukprot:XP_012198567.1 hypothetical protein SPRG_04774 [Saprolegnia parasitica CBS 223.65]